MVLVLRKGQYDSTMSQSQTWARRRVTVAVYHGYVDEDASGNPGSLLIRDSLKADTVSTGQSLYKPRGTVDDLYISFSYIDCHIALLASLQSTPLTMGRGGYNEPAGKADETPSNARH